MVLPYSRKIWRGIKFGALADRPTDRQIKIRQYLIRVYTYVRIYSRPPNLKPPIFLFTLVGTNPPNLMPAKFSGYTVSPISCVALNFLMAAALTFSLTYFPMRARSSGVKEVVYLRLLARLPPFSFGCKALTAWLTSWSTLGDSCIWLAVGRVVAG